MSPAPRPLACADEREAEFERLVLSMKADMTRAVWRVVHDEDLAEEALQNALAVLWRKVDELRAHVNPRAFVLRVCLDAACDQARGRGRRADRFRPLDAIPATAAVSGDQDAEERTAAREVVAAIARMRPRQATALLLRALHDASYREIASALGCSAVTARVHVMQARRSLRRALAVPSRRSEAP